MIAVDASALIALATAEPDADTYGAIVFYRPCLVGWPTILETRMVLTGKRSSLGIAFLDGWVKRPHVTSIAFDERHYRLAVDAFDRYGKGRHAAGLNFGDCMSYAIARANEVPLLYKGAGFALTDVRPALP